MTHECCKRCVFYGLSLFIERSGPISVVCLNFRLGNNKMSAPNRGGRRLRAGCRFAKEEIQERMQRLHYEARLAPASLPKIGGSGCTGIALLDLMKEMHVHVGGDLPRFGWQ
jgi:hypothetical protein